MTAWSPWKRRLCFALPFMMRALLCILRYSHYGGGDPDSFIHVIMQVTVYTTQFIFEIIIKCHHIV